MKTHFCKLRVPGEPVPAVFFTLTLWVVGYLFLIAFRLITWDWGYYGNVWLDRLFTAAMWLLPSLYMLASLRFFIPLYRRDCQGWQLRTALAITGVMLLVTANRAMAGIHTGRELWLAAIFFFLMLPAGMAIRGGWRNLLWFGIYLVAGTGGVLMAAAGYRYIRFNDFNSPETTNYPLSRLSAWVEPDIGRWMIYIVVQLLLLALGYGAFAVFLARTAKLPLRRVFARPIVMLWSAAAGLYLISWLWSLPAAATRKSEIERLESIFNRSLATAARQVRWAEPPVFAGPKQALIPQNLDDALTTASLRNLEISPETIRDGFDRLAATAPEFERIAAEIAGREAAADSKCNKNIIFTSWFSGQFYLRLEIEFLLALHRGDIAKTLRYEKLMRTCSQFCFPLDAFGDSRRFIGLEEMRLDKVELLLESGLLSNAALDEIDANLQQSGSRREKFEKEMMFSTLVGRLAYWDENFQSGFTPTIDGQVRMVPYCLLDWMLPMFRGYRLRRQLDELKNDLCCHAGKPWESPPGLTLGEDPEQPSRLFTRYQLMRQLIDCERVKRRTGKYPNSLPAELADRNWRYHHGEEKITVTHLRPGPPKQEQYDSPFVDASAAQNQSGIHAEYREITTPVISIRSVGPNGKDENGSGDDVLVIMRVKP